MRSSLLPVLRSVSASAECSAAAAAPLLRRSHHPGCASGARRYASSPGKKGDGGKEKVQVTLGKPRLDYARLLANPKATERNVAQRALTLAPDHVTKLADARTRMLELEKQLNEARAAHGRASSVFRDMHKKRDKKEAIANARKLREEARRIELLHGQAEGELLDLALTLPNFSHPDTPIGPEENAVTLETFGPKPLPASDARDHVNVATHFGWLDTAASAIATGTSWPYLIGPLAQLEHALVGFAVSKAIAAGYTPVSPPDVVGADVAWRCGFQPRDGTDGPRQTYFIEGAPNEPRLCLTGTAEIPLAAMWANRTLYRAGLPQRVVGVGRAFRAEAGARGADTRGLYRVHQFTKVELFTVTSAEPGDSAHEMDEIRALQRDIASSLGLSVRVLDMPTEELGASAARKYDMEAWMPGRGRWGEITSTSDCTDYQARRLNIRYRDGVTGTTTHAHTLNGTAAAVPRLIVALLENGVRLGDDGAVQGVDLPKALKPWWVGPEAQEGYEGGLIRWV